MGNLLVSTFFKWKQRMYDDPPSRVGTPLISRPAREWETGVINKVLQQVGESPAQKQDAYIQEDGAEGALMRVVRNLNLPVLTWRLVFRDVRDIASVVSGLRKSFAPDTEGKETVKSFLKPLWVWRKPGFFGKDKWSADQLTPEQLGKAIVSPNQIEVPGLGHFFKVEA